MLGFQVRWYGFALTALVIFLGFGSRQGLAQNSRAADFDVAWERTGLVAIGCRPKGEVIVGDATATRPPPTRMSWGVLWDQEGHVLGATALLGAPQQYDFEAWRLMEQGRWEYIEDVQWVGGDSWTGFTVLKIAMDASTRSSARTIVLGDSAEVQLGALGVPGEPRLWLLSGARQFFAGEAGNLEQRGLYEPGEKVDRPRWIYDYGGMVEVRALDRSQHFGPGPAFGDQGEFLGWILPWRWQRSEPDSQLLITWNTHLTRVVNELVEGKRPEFGFLGVRPRDISDAVKKEVDFGVSVYEVGQRTPAQSAGLQFGDVITHVNQEEVRSSQELLWLLGMLAPLDQVELQVVRGVRTDRPKFPKVNVTLAKRYVPRPNYGLPPTATFDGIEVDWATASPRFSKDWQKIDTRGAVVVIRVDESSPAWEAGLREGDFISEVDGISIERPRDFETHWSKIKGDVELRVNSGPNQLARVLLFPRLDDAPAKDEP